jgi:CRP/FNR family transcriptional regulator
VADALMRELADRVVRFVHGIPDGAFTSVRQRIARHMLDLASQGVGAATGTPAGLPVPSANGTKPKPWEVGAR